MRTDHITADQWPQYLQELLTTDERADYTVELNAWHDILEQVTYTSFDAQHSPEGIAWPPWQWRKLEYHNIPAALINSGRLYRSYLRGGDANVDEVGARISRYGSAHPNAAVHHFGGTRYVNRGVHGTGLFRRGSFVQMIQDTILIPPRPAIGVTPPMADGLADTIADSLVKQMKG